MSTNYIPARLLEGSNAWYITYYQENPISGKRERFRESYDLNRIPSKRERRKKANIIIKEINKKLPNGFPYEIAFKELRKKETLLIEALEIAKKIKLNNTNRDKTKVTVNSMFNVFKRYAIRKKITTLPVVEFDSAHALDFLDDSSFTRKIGNTTYNNYIKDMRSMFEELVLRKYIEVNPFSRMKRKSKEAKKRRAFNDHEKKVVATYIKENDKWLMLAVLLQYHCFIRPIEMRRMRFKMIDLKDGVIRMPGTITKNKKNDIVTIPDHLIPYLKDFDFSQWNQNWLLFGKRVLPHPNKCCGHNTMNLRHKIILEKLKKKGELSNIMGLSFYSWKDTGALELFKRKVNILEIMRQLRHEDLSTTQVYCKSLYSVNLEIKGLNNPLI